jgi:hypothetical protein
LLQGAELALHRGAVYVGVVALDAPVADRKHVAALDVDPSAVGNQPFESGAKRILRRLTLGLLPCRVRFSAARRARRTKQQDVAQLLGQPAERQREIDPEGPAQRRQGLANQLPVSFRPRCDRAVLQRQRVVGNETGRIEIVDRTETLTLRAGAVR